jgi:CBS-domain-containing membrane protein
MHATTKADGSEVRAGQLMSTPVVAVTTEHSCDAVPVVTAAGVLLGLVTATDLVAAVARVGLPSSAVGLGDRVGP